MTLIQKCPRKPELHPPVDQSIKHLGLPKSAFMFVLLFLCACNDSPPVLEEAETNRADPPAEAKPTGEIKLRTVYVPAYSHLPPHTASDSKKFLSVILSVRNVDSEATITLTHVDYFNTKGDRVRRYLRSSRVLRPLETAEFSIPDQDMTGGSGANFLVYWEGPADAHALLTEAVMYGFSGSGYISFASRGVELNRRPQQNMFDTKRGDLAPQKREDAQGQPLDAGTLKAPTLEKLK